MVEKKGVDYYEQNMALAFKLCPIRPVESLHTN